MLRIGIFFGGSSREREISFAGGRTVYDNLDKTLFEAIPLFVDSLGQLILLDWAHIYKGTIRDFYPSLGTMQEAGYPVLESPFQIYAESLGDYASVHKDEMASAVGRKVSLEELNGLIDVAFLALHGPQGEDGAIQGLLEWLQIPYTGSGILPSAVGISKTAQDVLMRAARFNRPARELVSRERWLAADAGQRKFIFGNLLNVLPHGFVVKAPHQGSSIGITVLKQPTYSAFEKAMDKALFIDSIDVHRWKKLSVAEKVTALRTLTDIREGIGLPALHNESGKLFEDPNQLWAALEVADASQSFTLSSPDGEALVIIEQYIEGKEFSCIVIEDLEGAPLALPLTEIVKKQDFFDYRSKYLPGMSRKVTPIDLPDLQIEAIRSECAALFKALQFDVYARIDGFVTADGKIFLNDPNTTSGMLPSSFFFHQAAEIGLNPSQFLTYILHTSLKARLRAGKDIFRIQSLLTVLTESLAKKGLQKLDKRIVAVVMGGFSSERHISVESGRNIFEKLSSSAEYHPIPVFLTGSQDAHELYELPISVMLKDNADDIKEKVKTRYKAHPVLAAIREQAAPITSLYAGEVSFKPKALTYKQLSEEVDAVFIALHGRPGEDGAIQQQLEKYGIPYNGSGIASSSITINKYETNELLGQNGIEVAKHAMVYKSDWALSESWLDEIERSFGYPIIAKPHDDGCSSAVKKIKTRAELQAYAAQIFRNQALFLEEASLVLQLKTGEEFPQKEAFLVEELISKKDADHFLEITGGMLTLWTAEGPRYEVFEPSEALATGEVLSLEEKFLAGEGQNITPARFSRDAVLQGIYSQQVRETLGQVAKILNVEGYCRIDAFVRIYENERRADTIIIEINSLPGMTPATCIFHQAAINNLKPFQFIDKILDYGTQKLSHKLTQSS